MSDLTKEQKEAADHLHYLKLAHDKHATVVQLFKTRFQFFHEEFQPIQELINFYATLQKQLLDKIQEIEPPAPKEKGAPMVVDISDARAKKETESKDPA